MQGIIGSGPTKTRFNRKLYFLIPILLIGIGGYVAVANNYFSVFDKDQDIKKGLVQATEVQEVSSSSTESVEANHAQPTDAVVSDSEASVEGESVDPSIETNPLPAGEATAVERAAAVNTDTDNHETEVMGGDN